MNFETPNTFEELDQLFKKSEESTPFDISTYFSDPIRQIVLKFGSSLIRLERLVELHAPESILQREIHLGIKYKTILLCRREEFLSFVHKINKGVSLEDQFILENLFHICVEFTKFTHRKRQEEIDSIPELSDKIIDQIDTYLISKNFKQDSAIEVEDYLWLWQDSRHPDTQFQVILRQNSKSFQFIIATNQEDWGDHEFMSFRDFDFENFKVFVENGFKKLSSKDSKLGEGLGEGSDGLA